MNYFNFIKIKRKRATNTNIESMKDMDRKATKQNNDNVLSNI